MQTLDADNIAIGNLQGFQKQIFVFISADVRLKKELCNSEASMQ